MRMQIKMRFSSPRFFAVLASSTVLASLALAQAKTFTIGAFATHQLAQVESFTDFETFTGRTDKVTGTLKFDKAKRTGSGKIIVEAKSIDTGMPLRNDHMNSPMWLDTEKFPTIEFTTTKVQFIKGDSYRVTGSFKMHGVTKTVTVNATVKHMAAGAATQKAGFKGDVLQVKTSFDVKLADYGIKLPPQAEGKVGKTVKISIVTYAQSG